MFISNILSVAWAASLFFGSSSALAVKRDGTQTASKLSLTFSSYSGYATPTNIPHVTRDGGGGGWLNGHFVIAFSDTTTSNSDGDMLPGGFVSNSAAYIPNTEDPLALEGFATDGVADLLVPWDESECVAGEDCNWDIWPENPVTTQYNRANDTVGYAIYAAATRSPATWQYNTLCKLTANDTGLTVTRPVQKYITSDFLYRWGWSTASTSAGDVYIFAIGSMNSNTTHNLYMVQVPFDDIEDTSKFGYWNGDSYSNSESDAVPITTGYFSNGAVFYSAHYSTYLIVYMGSGDETNDVYVQYSLSGNPQGPYSPPQQIVSTIVDPTVKHLANGDVKGDYNYGFQPYPQFFGDTAQEVLVSWDYGYGTQIQMAKLTFDP